MKYLKNENSELKNMILDVCKNSKSLEQNQINCNTLTFHRPTSNFDITIELKNGLDQYLSQIVNHQTFVLDIVGCDGYQRNPITNYQEIPVNNIDNRLQLPSFR